MGDASSRVRSLISLFGRIGIVLRIFGGQFLLCGCTNWRSLSPKHFRMIQVHIDEDLTRLSGFSHWLTDVRNPKRCSLLPFWSSVGVSRSNEALLARRNSSERSTKLCLERHIRRSLRPVKAATNYYANNIAWVSRGIVTRYRPCCMKVLLHPPTRRHWVCNHRIPSFLIHSAQQQVLFQTPSHTT